MVTLRSTLRAIQLRSATNRAHPPPASTFSVFSFVPSRIAYSFFSLFFLAEFFDSVSCRFSASFLSHFIPITTSWPVLKITAMYHDKTAV